MADTKESKGYLGSLLLLLAVIIGISVIGTLIYNSNKSRIAPPAPGVEVPTETPVPIAMVTIEIEVPDDSLAFRDNQYRTFFTYPKNWRKTEGEYIFVQGDLAQYSFSGSSVFAAGIPVVTDKDPLTIAKEVNGIKSVESGKPLAYSKVTIGRNKYDKVVDCDEICMTRYYTYHNGNVYMFYTGISKANTEAHEEIVNEVLKTVILF